MGFDSLLLAELLISSVSFCLDCESPADLSAPAAWSKLDKKPRFLPSFLLLSSLATLNLSKCPVDLNLGITRTHVKSKRNWRLGLSDIMPSKAHWHLIYRKRLRALSASATDKGRM